MISTFILTLCIRMMTCRSAMVLAITAALAGAATATFTATVHPYPGYNGKYQAIGIVELIGPRRWSGEAQEWYDLAYAFDGVDESGGLHIHSGASCASDAEVGGHFWDSMSISTDPWVSVLYKGNSGRAKYSCGYSLAEVVGHTLVVHDSDGTKIGCGIIVEDNSRAGADSISLELISSILFRTGYQLQSGVGLRLGGLSALAYDVEGRWWALSDRNSQFYELELDVDALLQVSNKASRIFSEPAVLSQDQMLMQDQLLIQFRPGGVIGRSQSSFDAEGLAACTYSLDAYESWYPLYVSTEDPSRVFAFNKTTGAVIAAGTYNMIAELNLAQTPISERTVIRNRQLESLSCAGTLLITANESPLVGDGPQASYEHGASVRIFSFGARDGRLRHTARYELEASPYPDSDSTGERRTNDANFRKCCIVKSQACWAQD
eukprot:SAG31_NODE_3144_length_4625_cov_3.108926_5_plen_435_part_00